MAQPGVPYVVPSPNQLSSFYDTAAIFNQLLEPDYYDRVFSLAGGYDMAVMPLIIERMRNYHETTAPRRVYGRGGANVRYVQGEMQVQQPVASVVASGNNLIITWQDPTYKWFRYADDVINNTSANIHGTVISPDLQAGSITIAPPNDGTALSVSDWNTVGQVISVVGDAFPMRSVGRIGISQLPVGVTNYTSTFRDDVKIWDADTYITYPRTDSGNPWIFAQQDLTNMWMNKRVALAALYSTKGVMNANSSNPTFKFQGLDQAIGDPVTGGVYDLMPVMPTATDFYDYWTTLSNKRYVEKNTMYHVVGRDYLTMIQNVITTPLITYPGIYNTLERVPGAKIIEGLDAYTFSVNAIRHIFIHAPELNDQVVNGNNSQLAGMQNYGLASASCYTLDMGSICSPQGGSTPPSMEEVYFGKQPLVLGVIEGMAADPFFMGGLAPEVRKGVKTVSTTENSNSLSIIRNIGYNFTCPNMGCHKPSK